MVNPSERRSPPVAPLAPQVASSNDNPGCVFTLAVVGDVHDQWNAEDASALHALQVDGVLFVGDFGNESIHIVQQVAALQLPIAVALGNHDAWYSATAWGRKRCPYDRVKEDRIQQQLEILAAAHVGYDVLDWPERQVSVVGGRPFSWGGPQWQHADFYAQRFDVGSMQASAERIFQASQRSQFETLIFLGHNGPTGLGSDPHAPCGKDWMPIGGDYGDPDLRSAIQQARAQGKRIPLVAFGHMHHHLRHTRAYLRDRIQVDSEGTVYLNAACVPRIRVQRNTEYHNFTLVTFRNHSVHKIHSIWVTATGDIASAEVLFESKNLQAPQSSSACFYSS